MYQYEIIILGFDDWLIRLGDLVSEQLCKVPSSLWWAMLAGTDFVMYHQISNISHTKSHNLKCFSSRLAVVFVKSIEARC